MNRMNTSCAPFHAFNNSIPVLFTSFRIFYVSIYTARAKNTIFIQLYFAALAFMLAKNVVSKMIPAFNLLMLIKQSSFAYADAYEHNGLLGKLFFVVLIHNLQFIRLNRFDHLEAEWKKHAIHRHQLMDHHMIHPIWAIQTVAPNIPAVIFLLTWQLSSLARYFSNYYNAQIGF